MTSTETAGEGDVDPPSALLADKDAASAADTIRGPKPSVRQTRKATGGTDVDQVISNEIGYAS